MLNKINISPKKQNLIVYIVFAVITFAVYWQVHHYDFINIDDNVYVTDNGHVQSGITLNGIRWAFSTTCAQYWHPVTWLSLMFDYQLYGLNPGGYHVNNVILHILSTLLLFWLFNRMTGEIWKSAFVAALFALHPLRVESVAWVAKRRDILCIFFSILTLCIYVYYTGKPVIKRYLLVLFSFSLALMSKPMVVTLPLILILLDYWPLGRFGSEKGNFILWQLREKTPFFILSAVFSIITIHARDYSTMTDFSLNSRFANALVSFMVYLEKIFWPHDMAVLQLFSDKLPTGQVLGSALLIIVISFAAIIAGRRLPYLFVGWLWYAITILPTLGIIQFGHLAMSDHHTYLPSIGIAIMLAWGIPLLFPSEDSRKIIFPISIAVLAIMAVLTWKQCGYWKNSLELCNHALQVTKDNHLALNCRGNAYNILGNYHHAIEDTTEAIRQEPDNANAYYNRGFAYAKLGQYQSAIEDFNKGLNLKQYNVHAYYIRGYAYAKLGQYQSAIVDFNEAIRMKPDNDEAYLNRGNAYYKLGQYQSAIANYNEAIRMKPYYVEAYHNRGNTYYKLGHYQHAIADYNEAIRLKPDNAEDCYNRGNAYYKLDQYQRAIGGWTEAIRLKPDLRVAYNNRGLAYFNQGKKELGRQDAQKACELGNCKLLEVAKDKRYCR